MEDRIFPLDNDEDRWRILAVERGYAGKLADFCEAHPQIADVYFLALDELTVQFARACPYSREQKQAVLLGTLNHAIAVT